MIALITATGCRPYQLKMCADMMKRQTYKGHVVWIIVDDCVPKTTDIIEDNFRGWAIIKKHPVPFWREGWNTQGRNLSVGINTLCQHYSDSEIEAIFIIEDDDYYRVEYLQEMMNRMPNYRVIGETNTMYYNVFFRRYVYNNNFKHSSLFQTAFRPEVIGTFRQCYMDKFIDSMFFRLLGGKGVNLFSANGLGIGIKGIDGRPGIGAGHERKMNMTADFSMSYLKSLIGNDYELYERYYGGFCL